MADEQQTPEIKKKILGDIVHFLRSRRKVFFVLFDLLINVFSLWTSLWFYFDGQIPSLTKSYLISILPWVVLIRLLCFFGMGLYRTLWQYVSFLDIWTIIKAVTSSSFLLLASFYFLNMKFLPRAVFIIDWLFLILCMGGARVLFRLIQARFKQSFSSYKKRILIVGANDAGELLVHEFLRRPELGYQPVGYLDHDPEKKNSSIHGIRVLGSYEDAGRVIERERAEEVIITAANVSAAQMRMIFQSCREQKISCHIVPRAHSFFSSSILPLELRRIDVSDLLGRELASVDVKGISQFFGNKKTLITGGGGSIGSELARVLCRCKCKELILADFSENNLYEIKMDLQLIAPDQKVTVYLADVCDEAGMERIFQAHHPDIVFPAAAHKQVPIVEEHYLQGIRNNVLGTKTTADLSLKYGAGQFVLISTDKAIHPRSIMGASKRVSELYLQSLSSAKTRFLTVRFGNVFNSRGSVVPLFRKQIAETRSVTLTDPEAARYFMDCTEAVFLILQAAIFGKSSEVFILDMGRQVKIIDLAYNVAQLMGVSAQELSIRYIGLRPGEKLTERICLEDETAQETPNPKIKIWKMKNGLPEDFNGKLKHLLELVSRRSSREEVIAGLRKIVPEYKPWDPPAENK